MKISIVITAYNAHESIVKLFESAMLDSDRHDIDFYLFLHSGHEDTMTACTALANIYPTTYNDCGKNRGLSRSWNDGILGAYDKGADVVVVVNDDIHFSPGDVDKIAKKAFLYRNNYMVSCAGRHGKFDDKWQITHGYSCFAINPVAIDVIGCFDENYFPAYLEDGDHHRRATLAGLVEENCSDTNIYHIGSAAIYNNELLALQNAITQRENTLYYIRKWGGINDGKEPFPIPFDSSKFGLRIAPESRRRPYPGFNRNDINMELL